MTTIFTHIPQLNQKLVEIQTPLSEHGIILSVLKDVPYGVMIRGENALGTQAKVTCYFSSKKGLSIVDNSKNSVSQAIATSFRGINSTLNAQPFRPRIGTDEAGKGDFFGPLVTAGFFIENEKMEQDLYGLGVRDSKKISDKKTREIAQKMRTRWGEHIKIIAPSVEKYNELYRKIRNLNHLLGWMHGRTIIELRTHFAAQEILVDEAVVDKFGELINITSMVPETKQLTVIPLVHGEDADIAIAAASIIARDAFLSRMERLSQKYEMTIPLGAGENVICAGKIFLEKWGEAALEQVAKTHFKTINRIV